MPGCSLFVLGLGQPQPSLAAGEERRRDLGEVAPARPRTSRRIARSTVSRQLVAQLLELLEAASRSSRCVESSTSRSFSSSYSSFASGLTWPSDSRRRSSRSSRSASSSRSSPSAGSAPAASSRRRASSRLGFDARDARRRPRSSRSPASAAARRSSTSAAPSRRSSSASSPVRAAPASARARSGASKRVVRDALERLDERAASQPRSATVSGSRVGAVRVLGIGALAPRRRARPPRPRARDAALRARARRPRPSRPRTKLAALRVVAEAFGGDGRNRRVEQLFLRDDRQLPDELARVAYEHDEAAEARGARRSASASAARASSATSAGSAMAERRRDCPLASRLDVEQRQREPLALLRERARRRRQSLALGERALERLQRSRASRACSASARARRERARRARGADARARREALSSSDSRALAAQLEPLARAAQPVEGRGRLSRRAGRVGELLLGPAALLEQRLERAPRACLRGQRPPRSRLPRRPRAARELRESSSATRARSGRSRRASFSARSAAVACSASGRSRFFTSASTSRARSTWIATRASFSSARWRRRLKRPEPGRLLDSARRSSGFEPRIASTRPWPMIECIAAAEPEVGEQLDEVDPPHRRAVDEVLALAAAVQPPHDRELGVLEHRPVAVRVVEEQLDLAEVRRPRGPRRPRRARRPASRPAARSAPASPPPRRCASAMLDFPEPFGPTTTATPGSRRTSTGSGNDLKPRSLIARGARRGRLAPPRMWERLRGDARGLSPTLLARWPLPTVTEHAPRAASGISRLRLSYAPVGAR